MFLRFLTVQCNGAADYRPGQMAGRRAEMAGVGRRRVGVRKGVIRAVARVRGGGLEGRRGGSAVSNSPPGTPWTPWTPPALRPRRMVPARSACLGGGWVGGLGRVWRRAVWGGGGGWVGKPRRHGGTKARRGMEKGTKGFRGRGSVDDYSCIYNYGNKARWGFESGGFREGGARVGSERGMGRSRSEVRGGGSRQPPAFSIQHTGFGREEKTGE